MPPKLCFLIHYSLILHCHWTLALEVNYVLHNCPIWAILDLESMSWIQLLVRYFNTLFCEVIFCAQRDVLWLKMVLTLLHSCGQNCLAPQNGAFYHALRWRNPVCLQNEVNSLKRKKKQTHMLSLLSQFEESLACQANFTHSDFYM